MPWTNAIGLYVPPEHKSALQLVKANENCYTGNTDDLQFFTPGKYDSKFKGRNIALIAILQAEKSRVLFAGSMDTFSNDLIYRQKVKYFRASSITDRDPEAETRENYIESVNSTPKLIMHALGWMMGMKNQFKVTMFRHFKLDDISQTEKFYVNDTVRFEMRIAESVDGTWLPLLHTDASFMAEFNRIDTFIRAPLQTKGDGRYYVDMQLPDVYGVYTFRTFITKPGYNLIQIDQKVTVNPTPYDHYPRFLECAYPYYLSAFSMMTGVFSLSFVFLYHKETAKVTQTKKDK